MIELCHPAPVPRKIITPGLWPLIALAALGVGCGVYRFAFGLAASTNMNQLYPWGIWIVADVSFIALAAGGFTTAAITYVFHREHFHAVSRPALLTALLGYTFACVALAADLGKYYNIWHPMLPSMWQGNSALFEVGMCVMCYLTVLYIEFLPVVCERLMTETRYPRLARWSAKIHHTSERVMIVFIVLGVGISCLHQSSLGHIMVLVPTKLHPLWHTPVLALLFLLSAIAVGFPTVMFVSLCGAWALRLRPPMAVCQALARYAAILLSAYIGFKVWDLLYRQAYGYLFPLTFESGMFLVEIAFIVLALVALLSPRVRRSPLLLALASLAAMIGIVINRTNVYLIGYRPPFAETRYFPSFAEWGLTIGLIAAMVLLWRAIAIGLPILTVTHSAEIKKA